MRYFSYGSNMSINRLLGRISSASRVGAATLMKYELMFHKVGRKDGSAKCDARETGDPGHIVHGVVFEIAKADKTELDREEGLGHGYELKDVWVKMHNGSVVQAFMYYATNIDPGLKPFDWYKEHVLRGARENGLPEEYIRKIEAVESILDADDQRRQKELSIYR